jgi:glycosyltransferase involved in cell wall biosynthesis
VTSPVPHPKGNAIVLPRRKSRPGTRFAVVGVVLMLLALWPLLPHVWSGTELVRLRHAMALGPDFLPQDDWQPPAWPASYRRETVAPDPYFVEVAAKLSLQDLPDDWARGVAISRHLLQSGANIQGGAIHDDLRRTYETILAGRNGYCGDFIRVFTAIANAAGMPMRSWAFSFDAFGGHGHIFAEVWNRQTQRWQLLDVFQNYYFTDTGAEPLSAMQFRQALQSRSPSLRLHPILASVPPGWADEAKAWDYFQRGLDAWYIPWGHNVFSYDAAWPVRVFGGVSRALEGATAIASGNQAQIRMLPTATNHAERDAVRLLSWQLLASAVAAALGFLSLLTGLSVRRMRHGVEPMPSQQHWPRACVVGPLPPPSGGMANQCEQLVRLLGHEGAEVCFVRTNAPYRPGWVGGVPVLRAGFRLVPYLIRLWQGVGRSQVVHVFANSGWAWHLFAAPALAVARLRGVPAIVNYRGGLADEFLSRAPRLVHRQLASAAACVTPSAFLQRVFARHGLSAEAIPNVVDLSRFPPQPLRDPLTAPHIVVTRNLEAIYDMPTALRTFTKVRQVWPLARLSVAGSGPALSGLQSLAAELGIADAVHFAGRIDNAHIAGLYAQADLVLNTSTVDNMPISILEALASGVPVVSTAAGGIPDLVQHENTALLAPVGDVDALAALALSVLGDRVLARHLREAGLALAAQYDWAHVRWRWQAAYRTAVQQAAT